jgi:acyl carrier protein
MSQMNQAQVHARVDGILCELFEVDQAKLKPSANLFTDLGMDSLDAIDLVIAFQKEFKIRPENAELQDIRTLDDVYRLVCKYYERVTQTN